jgi:hypothetical protein
MIARVLGELLVFGICLLSMCTLKETYSGSQYVICRVKLDEGESKHAALAQENGFGSA